MRNCVKVARQTLTLFVRVRILLPQPWPRYRGRIFRGVAQLGRALRSGRRGRWFESSHLDQLDDIRVKAACFYPCYQIICLSQRIVGINHIGVIIYYPALYEPVPNTVTLAGQKYHCPLFGSSLFNLPFLIGLNKQYVSFSYRLCGFQCVRTNKESFCVTL